MKGILRFHIAGVERQAGVPLLLQDGGPGLLTQSGAHRFHSEVWLGHGDHFLAERGGSLAGGEQPGHRTGGGQHILCRHHHLCGHRLQGAAAAT